MDKIISKYDYINGTKEMEQALQKELNSTNDLGRAVDLSGMKNIVNIFIKKICVKDYVQNVPRYSPGTWMASMTMRDISTMFSECVENSLVSKSDCQDCLFDLLLAMIRVGPGTSHFEVIDKLENNVDIDQYLKKLKGEKLLQMVSALKQHTYTSEKNMSLEDHTSLMNGYMSRLLTPFVNDRDDIKEPEIWSAFLDLYLFYLLHTRDVPNELHEALYNCSNTFWCCYDKNPYKGFHDSKLIAQHIKKLTEFIFSPDFPRGRQLETTTKFVGNLCKMEGNQIEAVWNDMLLLFKSLCLSSNVTKYTKILDEFKSICSPLSSQILEKNPKLFEMWAVTVSEIVEKMKEKKLLENVIPRMILDLIEKFQPKKGDEKSWFLVIKALWSVPTKEIQNTVQTVLEEKKFKRMWGWKENIGEAKNLISVVEKLELPTEGESEEDGDCNITCGDAVKALIELLEIQKLEHKIMGQIGQMSLTHMEKRSVLANSMVNRYASKLTFQKMTDVVPEVIKRLEVLITDTKYPWFDSSCKENGALIFTEVIRAYKTGRDIPTEANQSIIRIFCFALQDDCEKVNIENGQNTVWGDLLLESVGFISKHCSHGSGVECAPVLEAMMNLRHSDEEILHHVLKSSMQFAGVYAPQVCTSFFGPLMDWYIEEPSLDLMIIFHQIVEGVSDINAVLESRWDKFIQVAMKHRDSYHCQMPLYMKLAAKHPEVFTQSSVDALMKNQYKNKDIRVQVFMIMMDITKVKPQLFVKHMDSVLADKSLQPMEQYSVNGTIVNVAKEVQIYREPVLKYLLNVVKGSKDQTQMMVSLMSLQDICVMCGPGVFDPYKTYLVQRRDKEQNSNIQSQFIALLDKIEDRSLETVALDVKETQDDVDQLDTRVTCTEGAVGTLGTRVDQHDDDIQEVGETLDTVTQRVDLAEKDIEKTKVKIEEVDNKTMTNAPRWSKDLTKLMNPPNKHDWRLLAQRLGYSNQDIKAWASQHNPCMSVLSEWYATHKAREATYAVLTALQEMNRMDGAAIVENAMKASEDVVEDDEVEYASPPPVFLSYQWGHQDEVKLLRNHLQMAGYECWMDIGQMGGGDKLFEKIDNGVRGAKVIICCVSEKYVKSPNCNREVNLSVSLGKPMIPLLMEKMGWPPKGSMGPIFSEYLFVRFFQRAGKETDDDRIWPVAKFQEMLMQLSCYGVKPEESLITKMYKNWWISFAEVIVVDKTKTKGKMSEAKQNIVSSNDKKLTDVFLSYQWGKQKQIIALYKRLTGLGLTCWMDIHQMGGGDSLYEKIDSGVRECKVVLTCITQKYSLSANCRREVSLADALKKPIIPLLLEKMDWPPSGPMSMVFTQLLFINFYWDENNQMTWTGARFDELLGKIGEHVPLSVESKNTNTESKEKATNFHTLEKGDNKPQEKLEGHVNISVAVQQTNAKSVSKTKDSSKNIVTLPEETKKSGESSSQQNKDNISLDKLLQEKPGLQGSDEYYSNTRAMSEKGDSKYSKEIDTHPEVGDYQSENSFKDTRQQEPHKSKSCIIL